MNEPTVDQNTTVARNSQFVIVVRRLGRKISDTFHLKDDDETELPLSIIRYIPVSVISSILGVALLVVIGSGTLFAAFKTNVPLNGLIITIMLIGVGMSIFANFKLWQTGLFLYRMERLCLKFSVSDKDIEKLQVDFKKYAAILDCINMQNLLDNLKNTGALNVTDNDARMIKSKLGGRINRGRGKVTFLSGLLVMLGLLGTFLGLLGTIDAVGEAMNGMASIGSDDGEGDGMSGFIASLAAPLQGMGLAFSSSLFGLSGSLLVGTFQYFSSGAQDYFIERFSRWIDEQIPGMSNANKAAGRSAKSAPVEDAELKAWIVGFIQKSDNSQRELAGIIDAINHSTESSKRVIENSESLIVQQTRLSQSLDALNKGVAQMNSHQQNLGNTLNGEFTTALVDCQRDIANKLTSVDNHLGHYLDSQGEVVNSVNGLTSTLEDQIPKHVIQTSDRLGKALGRMNDKIARLSRQDTNNVQDLATQIKRLEKLVVITERRSAQRNERVQSDIQKQFRRESDQLKKSIGVDISSAVHKDVIPFIAKERTELRKIAKMIDKQYGRRESDIKPGDSDSPESGAA